ncbi:MAG: hypothetical protein LAT75_01450 [Candidatus Cyclonatronum sp.]|uniref:hypothetical protein n=1 Tax=Cyclonatronum sp. TaxID=3024185 RepID=UPI0025BC1A90|nr:hypothetical protein [Cyclonatronum sp.]MCC5934597.1 hypothetical protein [Balneolales bacterium]MCH8485496.1 hypothetical protein [Cyclonatronum sp.]
MKYLLFFILIFLLIRIAADAYMKRRERFANPGRPPFDDKPGTGFRQPNTRSGETRRRVGNVEDAEFEVIEERDEQKKAP